ncbi:hypothetical protein FM036_18600 [Nostoc sp. HG1]|nr:hypothetical protein [Nostoc sp. HG1]
MEDVFILKALKCLTLVVCQHKNDGCRDALAKRDEVQFRVSTRFWIVQTIEKNQIDRLLATMHNGTVITLFSLGLVAQADKLLETEK